MRVVGGTIVSADGSAAHSVPWRPGIREAARIALTVRRLTGSNPYSVRLQGGWSESELDADWADTALLDSGLDSDDVLRIGDADDLVWPVYRVVVTSTAAIELGWRLVGLNGGGGIDQTGLAMFGGDREMIVSLNSAGDVTVIYPWGIHAGDAYYDPVNGATPGEEAQLNLDLTVSPAGVIDGGP